MKQTIFTLAMSKGYSGDKAIYSIQKWIREKKGVHVLVYPERAYYKAAIMGASLRLRSAQTSDLIFDTYEEALEGILKSALNKLPTIKIADETRL